MPAWSRRKETRVRERGCRLLLHLRLRLRRIQAVVLRGRPPSEQDCERPGPLRYPGCPRWRRCEGLVSSTLAEMTFVVGIVTGGGFCRDGASVAGASCGRLISTAADMVSWHLVAGVLGGTRRILPELLLPLATLVFERGGAYQRYERRSSKADQASDLGRRQVANRRRRGRRGRRGLTNALQ